MTTSLISISYPLKLATSQKTVLRIDQSSLSRDLAIVTYGLTSSIVLRHAVRTDQHVVFTNYAFLASRLKFANSTISLIMVHNKFMSLRGKDTLDINPIILTKESAFNALSLLFCTHRRSKKGSSLEGANSFLSR